MADGDAAAPASAAAAAADSGDGRAKTPSDFLKSIKGKPVVVKLNSGVDYRGERSRRTKGEQGTLAAAKCLANACGAYTCHRLGWHSQAARSDVKRCISSCNLSVVNREMCPTPSPGSAGFGVRIF